MTETDRALLGERITAERIRQYGAKSAAYQAARLNSATWDRLEHGDPVREDRLTAAVQMLWPSSGGDWRKTEAPSAKVPSGLTDYDDDELLAEIRRRMTREEGGRGGDTTAKTSAGSAPADEHEQITDEAVVVLVVDPTADDPSPRRGPRRRRQDG